MPEQMPLALDAGAALLLQRQHGDTQYVMPSNLTRRELEIFDYAARTYDFVLPRNGKATGAQWIAAIRATMDETEPRNAAVIEVIGKAVNT